MRALFEEHYRALTQLAALLAGDLAAAEDITQAAFVAMHRAWRLLGTSDAALLYLRREVVRRARSRRTGRRGAAGQAPQPRLPGGPAAVPAVTILRTLTVRQREAIILRCWAGLSDTEIAAVTCAPLQAVTGNLKRGLDALAAVAEPGHEAATSHQPPRWRADLPPSSGCPTVRKSRFHC